MTVARIRRARRTRVRRGRTAAMRSARYRESVTGTIPRMRDDDGALSAPSLLRAVGLLPDGPLPWGRPVPGRSPGVFVVELPAPLPTAPIELTRVGKWLEHVPGLLLDGARPTSRALSARLASFWLPSQTVLYVGATGATISGRLAAMGRTTLGDRRPYAGGHWLMTLRALPSSRVWWAATEAIEEYEDALLAAFADGGPGGGARGDCGTRRSSCRSRTFDVRPESARRAACPGRCCPSRSNRQRRRRGSSSLPDGDAEGARGEPPEPRRRAPRATTVAVPRADVVTGRRRRESLGARSGAPAGGAADGHARRSGRDPDRRGRRAAAGRARRADRGEAARGHRPDPGRQGARRPQGERRLQLRARGAVVPRGARPGHRGAVAHRGHRGRAGGRVRRGPGFPGRRRDRRRRPTPTRWWAAPRRIPSSGRLSVASPVGRALLGAVAGDEVAVKTPRRRRHVPGRCRSSRAAQARAGQAPGRRRACAPPRTAPPGSETRGRACPGCSRRTCGPCAP